MRISNYPTDTLDGTEFILGSNFDTGTQKYTTVNFTVDALKSFLVGTEDTNEFTNIVLGGSLIFEGATADAHETTLGVIDPTADRAINLPNVAGTLPVLAAVSATQITATPEELNYLDITTLGTAERSKALTMAADGGIILPDSEQLTFGDNGLGLQIYHTGSHNNFYNLKQESYNYFVHKDGNNALRTLLRMGGSEMNAQLYHMGALRLKTYGNALGSTGGVEISGTLIVTDDVTLSSTSPQIHLTNTGTDASNWVSFNTSAGRQGFVGQAHTGQQIGLLAENAELILSSYGGVALTLGEDGAATFNDDVTLLSTSPQIHLTNTGTSASQWVSFNTSEGRTGFVGQGGSGTQIILHAESGNEILLKSGGSTAVTLDASQNATFAGTIGSGAITSTAGIAGTTGTFSGAVTGASYTGGAISGTTGAFSDDITLSSSSPQIHLTNTGTAASNWISFNTSAGRQGYVGQASVGQKISLSADNAELLLSSYGGVAITLGASQTATFAGSVIINGVTISTVNSGSQFTDNDTSIMTSTAINNRINASGISTTITVADTTDTSCFVGLWESATGDLAPKTDGALTYNAGTGQLTTTGIIKTGNASYAIMSGAEDIQVNKNSSSAGISVTSDSGNTGKSQLTLAINGQQNACIIAYEKSNNTIQISRHGANALFFDGSNAIFYNEISAKKGITMGDGVADPTRVDLESTQAITHNDHKGTLLFDAPNAGIINDAISAEITFTNSKIEAEANVIIQMKSNIGAQIWVYNIAAGSCKFKILNRSGSTITDGTDIDLVYTVINQN